MVQALAFAEIFLGLIVADAGYKGVTISRVVKGEAGENVPPAGLGSPATSAGSGSMPSEGGSGSSPGEALSATLGLNLRSSPFAPSPLLAGGARGFGPLPTLTPGQGEFNFNNYPPGTIEAWVKAIREHPGNLYHPVRRRRRK